MRLILNMLKMGNYVFFDKENGLHLSHIQPLGIANKMSSSIERAVKAGTVIDIDKKTGITPIDENNHDRLLHELNIKRVIEKPENSKCKVEDIKVAETVVETTSEVVVDKVKKSTSKRKTSSSKKDEVSE